MTFPRLSAARPPALRALRVVYGIVLVALLGVAALALWEYEIAWFLAALGVAAAFALVGHMLLAWIQREARNELALRQELRKLNRLDQR